MQVSTTHNGTLIEGVVLENSRYFLEVAITSPFANLSTRKTVPSRTNPRGCYEGDDLKIKCDELLLELFKVLQK